MSPENNLQNQATLSIINTPKPAVTNIIPVGLSRATDGLKGVDSGVLSFLRTNVAFNLCSLVVIVAFSIVSPYISLALVLLFLITAKNNSNKRLIRDFAKANDFEYQNKGVIPTQTGHLFFIGNSSQIGETIKGTYLNHQFLLFKYRYDIGTKKDRQTFRKTVFTMNIGPNFPTYILRRADTKRKKDDELTKITNDGYTDKLSLDANISRYIEVFTPPKMAKGTLTNMSPDFLSLISKLDKFEIELTPTGQLYIYTTNYIKNSYDISDLFKLIDNISRKIEEYNSQV